MSHPNERRPNLLMHKLEIFEGHERLSQDEKILLIKVLDMTLDTLKEKVRQPDSSVRYKFIDSIQNGQTLDNIRERIMDDIEEAFTGEIRDLINQKKGIAREKIRATIRAIAREVEQQLRSTLVKMTEARLQPDKRQIATKEREDAVRNILKQLF